MHYLGLLFRLGIRMRPNLFLAATLLTEEPVVLKNVPDIGDIAVIIEILRDLGAEVRYSGDHELTICTRGVCKSVLRADLCRKVRGSFMFAGPLLGRFGQATIPRPGGDRIGRRRVDTHLIALEELGVRIHTNHIYDFKAPRGLVGADIFLDERSVTGTENAVMAAGSCAGYDYFEQCGFRASCTGIVFDAEQDGCPNFGYLGPMNWLLMACQCSVEQRIQ